MDNKGIGNKWAKGIGRRRRPRASRTSPVVTGVTDRYTVFGDIVTDVSAFVAGRIGCVLIQGYIYWKLHPLIMSASKFSRLTRMAKGKGREVSPPIATTKLSEQPSSHAHSADDSVRVLWCLVDGDSAPFMVTTPFNDNVAQLKELIRDKGVAVPFAKDLVLLKVSTI
jgi:hypothetical protein